MIVYDKDNRSVADKVWREVSKGRDAFLAAAKSQPLPALAEKQGQVPPIHKHFGDKNLEDTAFKLKPNEISGLIHMQDGSVVILMCENHIPATLNVKIENEYAKIQKEMEELRVAQQIPEEFNKMRKAADPKSLLQQETSAVHFTSQPMPQLKSPAGVTPLRPSQPPGPPPGLQQPSVFNDKK
jgi:foldase protein PrsA